MLTTALASIITIPFIAVSAFTLNVGSNHQILASRAFSLEDRYAVKSVNDVFKDNILLNSAYLQNKISQGQKINWDQVRQPFTYQFELKPNQTFAFHDDVLPQYQGHVVKTTNAHFNSAEGFISDGYLVGDGVCHFASLINWAARDAKLNVNAPTNHDFAAIPDVPREYGVAIYNQQGLLSSSALQNLYITNNLQNTVEFKFDYDGHNLTVTVSEDN